MIKNIKGVVEEVSGTSCVIEMKGWGVEVVCGARLLAELVKKTGEEVRLWTWLRVYEEEIVLYGFSQKSELELFRRLITVSGVGPKGAMNIMDLGEAEELAQAIDGAQVEWIGRAKGIGKKTAQKIIVELRGKLVVDEVKSKTEQELVEIMNGLGFAKKEYEKLLADLPSDLETVEEKTQWLLRNINS